MTTENPFANMADECAARLLWRFGTTGDRDWLAKHVPEETLRSWGGKRARMVSKFVASPSGIGPTSDQVRGAMERFFIQQKEQGIFEFVGSPEFFVDQLGVGHHEGRVERQAGQILARWRHPTISIAFDREVLPRRGSPRKWVIRFP